MPPNMRATPLRGFSGELRPKRLGFTRRPRLSTHVERDGKDVILALSDGERGYTVRLCPGGAAALSLHLHHAANTEEEPVYAVDVVGEFERNSNEEPER